MFSVLAEQQRAAGAILTIDLAAVAANWGHLASMCGGAHRCAAVVKADAYGLGIAKIAPALFATGCRTFFVAHLAEGLYLRTVLPRETVIAVLNGPPSGTEADFAANALIPVLNCPDQIARWSTHARLGPAHSLPAILHVDTGMARLGLTLRETHNIYENPDRLNGVALKLVISHLACADTPANPMNEMQVQTFSRIMAHFPNLGSSLANSSGIFLGSRWHGNITRPGAALYGINPIPGQPNPMQQVVRLQGKVIQVRDVDSSESVGYGASYRFLGRKGRIATVAVGYADGFLRALSNRGSGRVAGVSL